MGLMSLKCVTLCLLLLVTSTQASDKPKVALCFFGLVKNTSDADIRNYRAAIFEPLQASGYEVEGFFHTYRMKSVGNRRNGEMGAQLRTDESIALWQTLVPFRAINVTDPMLADAHFCP